jgi:hypothetical protein
MISLRKNIRIIVSLVGLTSVPSAMAAGEMTPIPASFYSMSGANESLREGLPLLQKVQNHRAICAGACRTNYSICYNHARNQAQVNQCQQELNNCLYGC